MSDQQNATPGVASSEDAPATKMTMEEAIEQGKRAIALKQYEQAVDYYATALEILTEQKGDNAPEAADLYLDYGRALLENAISQTAVLGKEEAEEALIKDSVEGADSSKDPSAPFLSFSGDAEEDDALVPERADGTVDLFAEAEAAEEEDKEEEEEEGADGEEGEPADDFNAAWEVLDLARALYSKQEDERGDIKLKLAATYIALGDVSVETENFDQAITDYSAGIKLKTDLLPLSSREVAEAHYKLCLVLDLTSGKLALAIEHAEKALESVEARLRELRSGLNGQLPAVEAVEPSDGKGKGKGKAIKHVQNDIQNMSKSQIQAELKEVEELREDLALKVEELKASPASEDLSALSAPELAAKALDNELKVSGSSKAGQPKAPVVNDLTSMVVKKKKKPVDSNGIDAKVDDMETNGSGKRKAEDDGPSGSKKTKV